ncbi:hypothetical protein NL676_027929 [Syzygium grande]|nr:hypothetical protein NL676_027929 [Syzygium grande]
MGRKKPATRDEDGQAPVAAGKSKKKALVIDDDEAGGASSGGEVACCQQAEGCKGGGEGSTNKKEEEEEDDDVEKGVGEDDEDAPAMALRGRKKTKSKKGGNSAFSASNFGLLGEEGEDNEDVSVASSVTGGGDSDDAEDEPVVSFSGKKKPSKKNTKGGSSFASSAFDALNDQEGDDGEVIHSDDRIDGNGDDEAALVIAFTGKKKQSKGSKKGGSAFTASSFGALDEGKENENKNDVGDEEDVASITFSGKKKKSSKPSKMNSNSFSTAFLDEGEQDEEGKKDEDHDEDVAAITFSGKKKKSSKPSKKSTNLFSAAVEGDEDDSPVVEAPKAIDDSVDRDESLALSFSGKKKPSKKKSSIVSDVVEPQQPDVPLNDLAVSKESEDAPETSKNKKKKKKSGRTAQEEDDLDKILAELGETPSVSKPSEPPPEEEQASVQPEAVAPTEPAAEKEAEEESLGSAAAKKKKKKKEKEKEKKAAAAAAAATSAVGDIKEEKLEEVKGETAGAKKVDAKGKAADKKVPKHVREMQEALARRKEAEERKKREEEERLKKEEEERLRQEELERQAEEAKRRKKEREKEKLLKKKQEGRLLTGKQKEEARRLEAMRNQILASAAGVNISTGETGGAPTKRPKYQSKKSKPAQHQANGAAPAKDAQSIESEEIVPEPVIEADTVDSENVEEVETMSVEEKSEVTDAVEENGMEEEDDEEWDAKSWDDINISVKSSFADEEADSEPEPVIKKGLRNATPVSRTTAPAAAAKSAVAPKKAIVSEPEKSQVVETRKSRPEAAVMEKNRGKGAAAVPEAAVSDATFNPIGHNLRSPICCIMGHVDTGKTKLLDCIRGTNVQEGEAGGITQQIGATYFPAENIRERTKELGDAKLNVPGLLVIDTPGHESFRNLRSRGSGICDIAILVVDIMHGLEPQTIESLNLLRSRNTEFIVALNKVDRLYGWKTCRNAPIMKAMKEQTKDVQNEFNMRLTQIVTQFKEQGLNTELYYKNKEKGEVSSIVPTSAISGEGVPDLLLLLVLWTQKTMVEKLTFRDEVQCTVLEVKVVEGHGTTIDVVLVNGVLHEGDQIVVCGLQEPIATTIRALLTPHPMKELRVKGTYLHHKEIKAAQGIKITAQGLEHAIAGTGLLVVGPDDNLEDVKQAAMEDMKSVMGRIDRSGEGVCVQASTLGSLEALLEFLKSPAVSIPVSGISIGPVHKKDVMKASVMLEKKKEYATILAFDVKVTPEARELADELGVKIFIADIIYHLFDQFKAYIDNIKEEKKKEAADEAVFPCVLKILPNCVFNKKDPIVLGVDVLEGIAKVGTPVCVPQREFIDIGRIASIENNHKPVDTAKKGQKVAIKIVSSNPEEQQKMFGRHFDLEDELVSHITRSSIDILKTNYRDDLSLEEWRLVVKLKNLFKIQ